ncbi:MAG: pyridoxal-dependent decarboxylase [Candidatus Eremiobacteraeota bacterium]|nr:pyridoxal-dependent decarboxylase [Candidatus Eremiobacteraeota bacterium]
MRDAHEERHRRRLAAFDEYFACAPGTLQLEGTSSGTLEGWFLGPKAENEELFIRLIERAVREHAEFRRSFHPEDPTIITADVMRTDGYRQAVSRLETQAGVLFEQLKMSAPIASLRHQGHMLWDQALPAVVGYVGAMLYDQNNVAAEASPVTTQLEIQVGNDLCGMLGYRVPPSAATKKPDAPDATGVPVPWGHLTCDGSVANIEALWAARNIKLFPIALRAALRGSPVLEPAKGLTVRRLDDTYAFIAELDSWTLLNLRIDDVAGLPHAIEQQFGISVADTTRAVSDYTVQSLGLVDFYGRLMHDVPKAPVVLVPSTRHYSWPKAATLLGLGSGNLRSVGVDFRARMSVERLRAELETCVRERVPVISVVAVIGSTEESSVDPLRQILDVREEFRERGLDFAVHCDAAWGGYFNSMLRADGGDVGLEAFVSDVPAYPMSTYVSEQYRAMRHADSITVDPHKAGYAPYPAGGLCYRNSALRDVISLKAPVIFHSQSEPTVGIYGVEGSKPGAAAAAVYLAHRVIRPDRTGYGQILGECMWTSKRMYARLVVMEDPRFRIVFFQELPSEQRGAPPDEIAAEKAYIREHFVNVTNADLEKLLRADRKARELFMEIGSDQVILAYSFNFYGDDGALNQDPAKVNELMDGVFALCSVTTPPASAAELNERNLIVTSSSFDPALYGADFVDRYARRLGLPAGTGVPLDFLISTTMNPWTTETPCGDFLKVIEESLRGAVHRALDDMHEKTGRPT